jgi:hypothetical protein
MGKLVTPTQGRDLVGDSVDSFDPPSPSYETGVIEVLVEYPNIGEAIHVYDIKAPSYETGVTEVIVADRGSVGDSVA